MSDIILPEARAALKPVRALREAAPFGPARRSDIDNAVGSRAGSWGLLLFLKYEKAVGGDASE